jgi:hypothetical protein
VVENMRRADSHAVPELAREFGVPFLGSVPFDSRLEQVLGDPARLAASDVAAALTKVSRTVRPKA